MRISALVFLLLAAPALKAWPLQGKDLEGRPLGLPAALSGRAGVVVVGFTRASEPATEAWGKRLTAELEGSSRTAVFSVIQLQGAPGFVVPMIVRGVKKKMPRERWARTLVLREGRPELEAWAGYDPKAPDDAYVVVLASDGSARGRWHARDLAPLGDVLKALP